MPPPPPAPPPPSFAKSDKPHTSNNEGKGRNLLLNSVCITSQYVFTLVVSIGLSSTDQFSLVVSSIINR